MAPTNKVHVIGCGVLALDLKALVESLNMDVSMEFLPGGLHGTPKELRRRLQERIDYASRRGGVDRIAIAYGICGMGAADLHARNVPLVIPRVNDCIALFLGSDQAYRDQFTQWPGTYYVSAGWVTENASPQDQECRPGPGPNDAEYESMVEQFGEDNADAIRYFMNSWTRNYQRAAFIDTGVGPQRQRFADMARRMAETFDWEYAELAGTHNLLEAMLTTRRTTDDVLFVPPHHVTAYDAVVKKLAAVPVWANDAFGEEHVQQIVVDEGEAIDEQVRTVKLGLGIDAGGTYTDAVIFDFEARRALAKAKALTTRWDFTIGINEALDQLPADQLKRVELASVSTTLATNAIVEGQGQKAGLLIMPPYGLFSPSDITHRPIDVLSGRLEISGEEIEPVDAEQVRAVARQMVETQQVRAFAVTGYASHINPAHELAVKEIIEAETGLHVTCGHSLSDKTNYRVRAETAALNARIIPPLESLLEQVGASLEARGINAATMVVKSDGSLMNVATARLKPIETILSGPAASVAGAGVLAGEADALVVDIGGTTTDTAIVRDGQVHLCPDGASVGQWRTHVNALDLRTCGLGGDSQIAWERGEFTLGPRRIAPIAWLASRADIGPGLAFLERFIDHLDSGTGPMVFVTAVAHEHDLLLSETEARLLSLVTERPYSLAELALAMGCVSSGFVPVERLAQAELIQLCGLTPTDLLHAHGDLSLWPAEASRSALTLAAAVVNIEPDHFITRVLDLFEEMLAIELFGKQLASDADVSLAAPTGATAAILDNWLAGGSDGLRVDVTMPHPVVGIGAPVGAFLPGAARRLNTTAIIPPDADVANAIGAITSSVTIQKQAHIIPNETGHYLVEGLAEAPVFPTFDEACQYAMTHLKMLVRQLAHEAGTRQQRVELRIDDRTAEMDEGRSQLFLGRTIIARLTGQPDLARW